MSLITLQVGQCGNQIGGQFLNTISQDCFSKPKHNADFNRYLDYLETSKERFFYESMNEKNGVSSWTARAVLVDMEAKVIEHTVADAKKTNVWSYAINSQISKKCGSGNNWANGFYVHGLAMEHQIMEAIQYQAEKCDRLSGFVTIMSLAGGTGSGVGSYLSNCLKDEFTKSSFANQIVLPYISGEVAVQNYNSMLSMAHLYNSSDVILCFDNDLLQYICQKKLSSLQVSFYEINDVISKQLTTIFQPYTLHDPKDNKIIRNTLGDFIKCTALNSQYKLTTVISAPLVNYKNIEYTTFHWPAIIKSIHQTSAYATPIQTKTDWLVRLNASSLSDRYLSRLLITRGDLPSIDSLDLTKLSQPNLYVKYAPPTLCGFKTRGFHRSLSNLDKSATLVENGRGIGALPKLDSIVQKAWDMFSSRAYVHQYRNYGMEEDDFIDCFAALERVLDNYSKL